jgi:hypothetical protein
MLKVDIKVSEENASPSSRNEVCREGDQFGYINMFARKVVTQKKGKERDDNNNNNN